MVHYCEPLNNATLSDLYLLHHICSCLRELTAVRFLLRLSACIHAEHCPFGQYLVEVERKYFKASIVFGYKIHLDERKRKAMNRLEEIDHGRLHEQEDSIVTAERDSLFSVS